MALSLAIVVGAAGTPNTVYAAGKFHRARPAGSAAGTNEVTRSNLLAYNLTTGTLQTTLWPT